MMGLRPGNAGIPTLQWRGRALGGPATVTIRHCSKAVAQNLVGYCVGEIERLERVFSLYRRDSEISRLNNEGRLDSPSHDIRLLLADARHYGDLSGGSFDVTVQPLWNLYSRHFHDSPNDALGPDPGKLERRLSLVDHRRIDLDNGRVALARAGMGVTLNGIAQGYITDRIANMLRDAGLNDVLVDLGEIRALDDGYWKIGIADPDNPRRTIMDLPVNGRAVATSAGAGSRFEPSGRFHHLLNPITGQSAHDCLSVTVLAGTATLADALATAMAISPIDQAPNLLRTFKGDRAILVTTDRNILDIRS